MKIKNILLNAFLILLIAGCSSSNETTNENNLSTSPDSHYSSNNLGITIPNGWREIKDNHEQLFDIWLVNDNNNAVISFLPITLDSKLITSSIDDQLDIIEKIITDKRKSTADSFEIIEESNIDYNYKIRLLKFRIEGIMQTSLLFGNGSNYYECLSYFKKDYNPTISEIENLIEIQTQIITECSIK